MKRGTGLTGAIAVGCEVVQPDADINPKSQALNNDDLKVMVLKATHQSKIITFDLAQWRALGDRSCGVIVLAVESISLWRSASH